MAKKNTNYVRVNLRMGRTRFFRAGIEFDSEWQAVEVDDATAATLAAEQMLEVSETDPEALTEAEAEAKAEDIIGVANALIDGFIYAPEPEPVAVESAPEPEPEPVAVETAPEPEPTSKKSGKK